MRDHQRMAKCSRNRRIAGEGENNRQISGQAVRRQGFARPYQRSSRRRISQSMSTTTSARLRGHRRQEEAHRGAEAGRQEASTPSTSRLTLIAKARRSATTCRKSCDGKQERRRKIFRVMFNEITKNAIKKAFEKPLAGERATWWTRSRRGACSTGWWATRSRRCCGTRCGADCRPGACRRSRCG